MGALSFFEIGPGVAFGLHFDLYWTQIAFFPPVHLSQPTNL